MPWEIAAAFALFSCSASTGLLHRAPQAAFAAAELSRSTAPPAAATAPQQQQEGPTAKPAGAPAAQQAQHAGQDQAQGQFWQRKVTPLEQSLVVQDPWAAALGLAALASGSKDGFEQVGWRCAALPRGSVPAFVLPCSLTSLVRSIAERVLCGRSLNLLLLASCLLG